MSYSRSGCKACGSISVAYPNKGGGELTVNFVRDKAVGGLHRTVQCEEGLCPTPQKHKFRKPGWPAPGVIWWFPDIMEQLGIPNPFG